MDDGNNKKNKFNHGKGKIRNRIIWKLLKSKKRIIIKIKNYNNMYRGEYGVGVSSLK